MAQQEQDALLTYHCLSSLGLYYFKTEDAAQAHHYFDLLLANTSQPSPNELMAIACHHKGLLYMKDKEMDSALQWLGKGMAIRNTIGNEYRKLPSYFGLTTYYYAVGNHAEGEKHYAETERLLEKYSAQLDATQRTEMKVELLLLRENYKQAVEEIKNSKLKLSDLSMVSGMLHESFSLEREKTIAGDAAGRKPAQHQQRNECPCTSVGVYQQRPVGLCPHHLARPARAAAHGFYLYANAGNKTHRQAECGRKNVSAFCRRWQQTHG
jgi:tetratricopeptide (TPR) repeat protein